MKTVVITGASSGIGAATARLLLQEGHTVFAVARRLDAMAELEELGATVVGVDVTDDAALQALVDRVVSEAGGIDVLVNNAGFGSYGSVEDTELDDARYQFEVNLFGLARLTQLVLPHMRSKGSGTIVNMSSMGGRIYTPLGAWYHATKHAVEGWSDCLRLELAPFGIDVVVIQPGVIRTEFADVMVGQLLERSGSSAYGGMASRVAAGTTATYGPDGKGSPPSDVATVISKVLRARRPKTRYKVGRYARPLMALRRWGTDRMFDRVIGRAG